MRKRIFDELSAAGMLRDCATNQSIEDDARSLEEWHQLIESHTKQLQVLHVQFNHSWREVLVKLGVEVIAAIEAHDRNHVLASHISGTPL
jgi:hypothetical protein